MSERLKDWKIELSRYSIIITFFILQASTSHLAYVMIQSMYSQTYRQPLNNGHLSTTARLSPAGLILIPILIEKPLQSDHLCTTATFGGSKGGHCIQVWLYSLIVKSTPLAVWMFTIMKIGLEKYQQRQSSTLVDYYILKDLFPKELYGWVNRKCFFEKKKVLKKCLHSLCHF
jgi:hypothetical protein